MTSCGDCPRHGGSRAICCIEAAEAQEARIDFAARWLTVDARAGNRQERRRQAATERKAGRRR